jgi:hypothetical protein
MSASRFGLVLLAGALFACNRSGATDDRPRAAATPPAPAAEQELADQDPEPSDGALLSADEPGLVGMLIVNQRFSVIQPSEYCLDDGQIYAGAPARIGRLNVFARAPVEALGGKTVLARGRHEPSLLALLRKQGPCPDDYGENPRELPQMRSDWISPEGSFLTTRAKLDKLPCFRARSVREVDLGQKLSADGDTIVVELRNPFAVSLSSLAARAHYEGGPGKPMPRLEKLELSLPPGGKQRFELAAEVEAGPAGRTEGKPRGLYRLQSVDLEGRAGKLDFDVAIVARRSRR